MKRTLQLRLLLVVAWVGLFVSATFAQTGIVHGTVSDKQSGEKLPGANLYVEGTNIGTSTDIDGKFTLKIPAGKITLIISYTGYQKQQVILTIEKDQTILHDFILAEDKMMLDEVVVIGYGTKRKRDITSSISSVKSEDIKEMPVENFSKAMQGKAPGVQITSDNGLAGGAVTTRIRGTSSILASSEPLYVVDGVPIVTGDFANNTGFPDKTNVLSQIDPGDIASIEVLKDAAAAAIYGARSANGVILITTKKGQLSEGKAKTNINFNYYQGFSTVTNKLKVLDGPSYLRLTKEAWLNSSKGTEQAYYEQLPFGIYNTQLVYQIPYNEQTAEQIQATYNANKKVIDNTNSNWIDESLQVGKIQSAALSAQGGTSRTQYYLGGSYYNEKGFIKKNDFQRINGRVNFSHNVSDRLSIGANTSLSYSINNRVPTGWAGGLGTAQSRSLPIMPIYTSSGDFFNPIKSNGTNTAATRENLTSQVNTLSLLANVFAEFKFTKWLNLRNDFGLNNVYLRDYKYEGRVSLTPENSNATDRRVNVENWTNFLTLNADKTFNKHSITGLLGIQAQNSTEYGEWINGAKFPSPSMKQPSDGTVKTMDNWIESYGFLSMIGRAAYAFNNKYYLSFSLRRDASSRFGPDHKWGWFPAASAGWTITEEKFIPENVKKILSFFKFRGSYGITGNAGIGNYQYFGSYTSTTYNGLPGIRINNVGNPKLGWESTAQTDVGCDFGLWNGRVSGGFDYYYKHTTDMLLNVNIPQTTGSSTVTMNVGALENKGVELFLTSKNFTGKFKWTTDFNISNNKNKILSIEGQIIAGENYGNNQAQEGHPIGAWRLVPYAGVDPQTGKELYHLANGKTGTWDDSDPNFFQNNSVVTGNPYPTWFGGITNTFSYKGFDLAINFTYQWGNDIYRDDGKFFEGGQVGANWNQMTTLENAWKKPGDVTDIPQNLWTSTYSTHNSTRYLDDGRFVRLKSINLGYTIPENWSKAIRMNSVRIYVTAENWLTWTKYKGWDPEVNRDGSGNITQGVTYLSPPQGKTITFGINLNL
ncbi:MAG: TonB-dependent receptor [Bacteroidetes bacterium]|nr:TonB-dependent receptor [Bacteroidota bacterium]